MFKNKVLYMIYSLLICLIIMSIVIIFITRDIKRFESKYYRYNISERTSITKYESIKIVGQTIDFILGTDNEELIDNYYLDEEMIHLKDVRKIFWLIKLMEKLAIFLFAVSSIIIYRIKDDDKFRSIGRNIVVINLLLLIMTLFIIFNFKNSFYIFHKLIFTNEYWLLNSRSSILISLIPEKLFFDSFVKIICIYTLIMIIIKSILCFIDKLLKIRV